MTLILSFMVFSQIKLFGMDVSILRMTAAAIDRTVETEQMPRMDENGKALAPKTHDISFEHVSFSYEKKPVLRDVTVNLPDKTTTAVIGPSGSGKTTFCNLIARFWDVDSGCVRIGGVDVRDYTLESLMDQISIVFQNVYLFADTIENNIKFGCPNATHAQVVEAAKKACCDDFIESLPKGYETVIGEGGASLSGGERQRVAIARAILKDSPIILLDEALSSLDAENAVAIQKGIEEMIKGKTVFLVSHTLSYIQNADQILVLSDGILQGCGKHEELLQTVPLYQTMWEKEKSIKNWKLA